MLVPLMAVSQMNSSGSAQLDLLKEDDIFQTRLSQFISPKERYRYNEFTDGRVYSLPHRESNVTKLNYNLLLKEMVMINESSDTMFVANFENIKYVLVGNDLYYHDFKKGYYELLSDPDDSVRLATRRWLEVQARNRISDVERPQLEAYRNYFRVVYRPLNQTLSDEVVKLSREVGFFLIDQKNEIYQATKSAFFDIFSGHKKEIQGYLKRRKQEKKSINFKRREDLKTLLTFCLTLH